MGELFEVVNPSDRVTFEADDELTAHVAVPLVGNGAYGTRTAEGNVVAPDHASLDALILARSEAIERAFRRLRRAGRSVAGEGLSASADRTDLRQPGAVRVGKHAAGRLLDGVTHDGLPGVLRG